MKTSSPLSMRQKIDRGEGVQKNSHAFSIAALLKNSPGGYLEKQFRSDPCGGGSYGTSKGRGTS